MRSSAVSVPPGSVRSPPPVNTESIIDSIVSSPPPATTVVGVGVAVVGVVGVVAAGVEE